MAQTVIGVNDAKAVRKYSGLLAVDTVRKSYFNRKFMGVGEDAETPIQTLVDLETDAGDTINYDLVMQLKMAPIEGDNVLEGRNPGVRLAPDAAMTCCFGGATALAHSLRKAAMFTAAAGLIVAALTLPGTAQGTLAFTYVTGTKAIDPTALWSQQDLSSADPSHKPRIYQYELIDGPTKYVVSQVWNDNCAAQTCPTKLARIDPNGTPKVLLADDIQQVIPPGLKLPSSAAESFAKTPFRLSPDKKTLFVGSQRIPLKQCHERTKS